MTRRPGLAAVALATVMLAACGGGGATNGPGASNGSGATPAPGATTTGGGADPCSNLTADEAAGAMATGPLTTTPTPGDPASCVYSLDEFGEALTVTYLQNGAEAQYQAFLDAGSVDPVPGIGDKALFESGTGRLLFLVGDTFVMVRSTYVSGADADALTGIGRIIVARMTTGTVPPDLAITAPPVLSAEKACDLLSGEEAASVLGTGAVTAAGSEVTTQFCTYSLASGDVVATTYFQAKNGATSWGVYESSMTTEAVAGLGEKAMFEPSTNILFVLKGDSIFNVNVLTAGIGSADALAQGTALARIMLTHL